MSTGPLWCGTTPLGLLSKILADEVPLRWPPLPSPDPQASLSPSFHTFDHLLLSIKQISASFQVENFSYENPLQSLMESINPLRSTQRFMSVLRLLGLYMQMVGVN